MPTREQCLELDCLSEAVGIDAVLVSRKGAPTLESEATVRGDVATSAIGEHADRLLDALRVWTEGHSTLAP